MPLQESLSALYIDIGSGAIFGLTGIVCLGCADTDTLAISAMMIKSGLMIMFAFKSNAKYKQKVASDKQPPDYDQ
jgi:hypothetical protein